MIAQNLKKGTKGFLLQLEAEAKEAQEERKQLAKRLGEEAGTKLVFPMLVMLVIVLAIVMVPALLSFSKGGL
jgi:1,4-dihydroxy-2-naphthoate octaprenyltransferase